MCSTNSIFYLGNFEPLFFPSLTFWRWRVWPSCELCLLYPSIQTELYTIYKVTSFHAKRLLIIWFLTVLLLQMMLCLNLLFVGKTYLLVEKSENKSRGKPLLWSGPWDTQSWIHGKCVSFPPRRTFKAANLFLQHKFSRCTMVEVHKSIFLQYILKSSELKNKRLKSSKTV